MTGWSGNWRPLGTAHEYGRRRPTIGSLVAFAHSAWEVTHLRPGDFGPDDQSRLAGYRPDYRDGMRPYSVTLRRVHGPRHEHENSRQEMGLGVRAFAYGGLDRYEDGRVPLCSCHSHPWPCAESEQQKQAAAEIAAAEKVLNLLPGCCPACSEVVTSRQRSITFGGPNVSNPFAEGPTYHLRRKCWRSAAAYEERWVADEVGRKRSLLTLRCEGTVIVHGDGTAECFGANDSACPSVYADHRGYSACYIQSHGCPQGCSTVGHPGTRIAGRPSHPRAVTA